MKNLECDGYGSVPAKYMFIGISAGRLGALITKVPFTKDASGRIFQRCLHEIGLSDSGEFTLQPVLKECYITNLVKARILTTDGLNRLPTTKEVFEWLPYLKEEIVRVEPKTVIALGDFVAHHLRWFAGFRLIKLRHPRWYQSHGALNPKSQAYMQMVQDYEKVISGER